MQGMAVGLQVAVDFGCMKSWVPAAFKCNQLCVVSFRSLARLRNARYQF